MHYNKIMKDIQNNPSELAVAIDRVGVRGVSLPIVVRDKVKKQQHTVAEVDLAVDLPAQFKGTHMSRFVEALEDLNGDLDYPILKNLLEDIKKRLDAHKAYVSFKFPYYIKKYAPVTKSPGVVRYDCILTGEIDDSNPDFLLEVKVPVMTVCPCSLAISEQGAHSQRSIVHISVKMRSFSWIEDFIQIAESSASSPVYTSLKREDEKYVTEYAFDNPCFVEDVVRGVADKLYKHEGLEWFKVEVESFESIHGHNAFACIEWPSKNA